MILYLRIHNLTLEHVMDFHGRICFDGNIHCILKIDLLQGEANKCCDLCPIIVNTLRGNVSSFRFLIYLD